MLNDKIKKKNENERTKKEGNEKKKWEGHKWVKT
jgi:hypothetical protein